MHHDATTDAPAGPCLQTSRLVLKPLSGEDLHGLQAMFALPGVRRHLFDERAHAPTDMAWVPAVSMRRFETGAGLWTVAESADPGALAGLVGFWRSMHRPPWPPEDELVFALNPSHWGRGLAAEASEAALRHVRDALGWVEARASIDDRNCAAVRTVARLGFRELGYAFRPGCVSRVFGRRL